MAPPNPVWTVPGKPWFNQIGAVRRTLIEHVASSRPLPIATLIDMLPLNPTDGESLTNLAARGSLEFLGGSVGNSAQDITRGSFLDDNVGAVRLIVPATLSAQTRVRADSIELENARDTVLLVLPELPAQYPFSGNFVLRKLALTPDFVLYTLQDQVEPHGFFEIKVDLRLDMTPLVSLAALRAMPAHRQRKVRMAIRLMAAEGDSCFGHDDGSASWYITRDMMGLCRIQHKNEPGLGTVVYGPATRSDCEKQLKKMQDDGSCA